MSTPPRPSLADTIARIDQALTGEMTGPPPPPSTPLEDVGNYLRGIKLEEATFPQLPVLDSAAPHPWRGPDAAGELVDEFAAAYPAKPTHLSGPPGPTCPGCAARDAGPGWLARALRRLFSDGAS